VLGSACPDTFFSYESIDQKKISRLWCHTGEKSPRPDPLESIGIPCDIFVQMTRPNAVATATAPVTEAAQSALAKVLNQVFFLIRMWRNSQVFQDFGNLLH
jgi:hypothetical protein